MADSSALPKGNAVHAEEPVDLRSRASDLVGQVCESASAVDVLPAKPLGIYGPKAFAACARNADAVSAAVRRHRLAIHVADLSHFAERQPVCLDGTAQHTFLKKWGSLSPGRNRTCQSSGSENDAYVSDLQSQRTGRITQWRLLGSHRR
jgi:hypothetical protein